MKSCKKEVRVLTNSDQTCQLRYEKEARSVLTNVLKSIADAAHKQENTTVSLDVFPTLQPKLYVPAKNTNSVF